MDVVRRAEHFTAEHRSAVSLLSDRDLAPAADILSSRGHVTGIIATFGRAASRKRDVLHALAHPWTPGFAATTGPLDMLVMPNFVGLVDGPDLTLDVAAASSTSSASSLSSSSTRRPADSSARVRQLQQLVWVALLADVLLVCADHGAHDAALIDALVAALTLIADPADRPQLAFVVTDVPQARFAQGQAAQPYADGIVQLIAGRIPAMPPVPSVVLLPELIGHQESALPESLEALLALSAPFAVVSPQRAIQSLNARVQVLPRKRRSAGERLTAAARAWDALVMPDQLSLYIAALATVGRQHG